MWVKRRHSIVFAILRFIFAIVLFFLYRLKVKKYHLGKGPHLILSNHQTTLDPFIISLSFEKPIYFMASEDLFIKGLRSKLIKYLVSPIPKKKSSSDIGAIKTSIKVIKEGGNIAIFPEGNRTYSGKQCYIDPSIVKLIRRLNVPIIFYNIIGGYGTSPRWANQIRRGKMSGEVKTILTPIEIKALTNEQLYNFVLRNLDVVDAPSTIPFHSKKRAEKLERVLYLCPQCHQVGSLYTKKEFIKCRKCQLSVEYTPYLTFSGPINFKTVNDWYSYQEKFIKNFFLSDDKHIFDDNNVNLYETTRSRKPTFFGNGCLSITKNNLIFDNKEFILYFKNLKITSMTIVGKHKLNFYIAHKTYQIKGKSALNVFKYMQIFFHIKGVKHEFVRL